MLNQATHSQHTEPEHTTLSKTFFDIPQVSQTSQQIPQISISDKHIVSQETSLKDTDTASHAPAPTAVFKRNNRQNIILNLLKKKKDVSIKDISQIIRDCSEKTIQRELIALIEDNIIQKTGERRWSRYSLKTPATL